MTKLERFKVLRNNHSRNGAMLVLIAFVLVIFLISAALSVDVANMHMVRAELRTATDAAARAGAEALTRTQDADDARNAAIAVAALNNVAGEGLTLDASSVQLGNSSPDLTGTLFLRRMPHHLTRFECLPIAAQVRPMARSHYFCRACLGERVFRHQNLPRQPRPFEISPCFLIARGP